MTRDGIQVNQDGFSVYKNGFLNNTDDLPAVVRFYDWNVDTQAGSLIKELKWYSRGKQTRVDEPAIVRFNEEQEVVFAEWYTNDKLNRLGGPARQTFEFVTVDDIQYEFMSEYYYANGVKTNGATIVVDGQTVSYSVREYTGYTIIDGNVFGVYTLESYVNGIRHSVSDRPALVTGVVISGNEGVAFDRKIWYNQGKISRGGGNPAIVFSSGRQEWYVGGLLSRTNQPAIVDENEERWSVNGRLHRVSGPAVTLINTNLSVELRSFPLSLDEGEEATVVEQKKNVGNPVDVGEDLLVVLYEDETSETIKSPFKGIVRSLASESEVLTKDRTAFTLELGITDTSTTLEFWYRGIEGKFSNTPVSPTIKSEGIAAGKETFYVGGEEYRFSEGLSTKLVNVYLNEFDHPGLVLVVFVDLEEVVFLDPEHRTVTRQVVRVDSSTSLPLIQEYKINGKFHRLDNPAVIQPPVSVKNLQTLEDVIVEPVGYYYEGVLHRIGGPAHIDDLGTEEFWVGGKISRAGGLPAIIRFPSRLFDRITSEVVFVNPEEYWVNGLKHRVDGPAVVTNAGVQEFWIMGKRSRVGGLPAVIGRETLVEHPITGVILNIIPEEYWVNDERHRTDGPAVIRGDGGEEFWISGKRSRVGGLPAVTELGGSEEYWLEGFRFRSDDLPAVVTKSRGVVRKEEWWRVLSFVEDDKPIDLNLLHRDGGLPAVIYYNTFGALVEEYWVNGGKNRAPGPAVEHSFEGKLLLREYWKTDYNEETLAPIDSVLSREPDTLPLVEKFDEKVEEFSVFVDGVDESAGDLAIFLMFKSSFPSIIRFRLAVGFGFGYADFPTETDATTFASGVGGFPAGGKIVLVVVKRDGQFKTVKL
jgi:hypothetical protein